jgi:hypothetical protein
MVAAVLAALAAAHAAWSPPQPVGPAGPDTDAAGVAVSAGDRPAVLTVGASRTGGSTLLLRRAATGTGRFGAPRTVASSRHGIEPGGLYAGAGRDLVAGWLEIVGGTRRPVVATGPDLADRQVLAPGPRSTQFIALAADARGDAVVAFWRYEGSQYAVWASYRPAGGRFSPAQMLVTGNVGNPAVAIDDDGHAVVTWTTDRGVQVADRAAGATAFAAPQDVPGAARPFGQPSVGIHGGRAVVAWGERGSGTDRRIVAAQRTAPQTAFGPAVTLSRPGVRVSGYPTPSVAFDVARPLVAWVEGAPGTVTHDHAAVVTADGPDTWTTAQTRGVSAPEHIVRARLTGAANGRRPLLAMTAQRGARTRTLTLSLRANGDLGPTRTPPSLGTRSGFFSYAAQGTAHTYLLGERPLNAKGLQQPLLLSSAS